MSSDNVVIDIDSITIETLFTPETTYNFEVADYHTYYVGECSVLVHNRCKQEMVAGNKDGWNAKVSVGGELQHKMGHAHVFWKNQKLASVNTAGKVIAGSLPSKGIDFVKNNIDIIKIGIEYWYFFKL